MKKVILRLRCVWQERGRLPERQQPLSLPFHQEQHKVNEQMAVHLTNIITVN